MGLVMAEMKAGYKQTDIGVIPEDWDVMSVFDFGSFKSGNGFPLSYQGHQNGDLPFFKVSDMNNVGNGTYMKNANNYVSDEVSRTLKLNIIPEKSIVFAKIGAAIFLERKKLTVRRSCIDNNMMAYLLNHEIGEIEYFRYLFLNTEFGKLVSTTALPSLSPKDIGELRYGFPKKKEQQRIAAVLSDVDGLIESLEKLIIKKRDMKTAAMQQLLTGKKRLPEFGGEWKTAVLESLADFFKGKFLPKSAICVSGQFSCIHYGELFTHYPEKIKDVRFKTNQPINTSFLSKTNDVLMPTSDVTPNGLAKASCISQDNVILGGDILVIRPKKSTELNGVFLSYLIRFHKDEIMKRVSGTTVYHLYASDIKNLPIDLPGIEEQDAVVSVLEDMSEEIDTLEQRLAKALSLKTGMMQELLTGKTRFIKTDKKQEAA